MTGNKAEEANDSCGGSSSNNTSKATNPFFVFLHEFRQNLAKRGAIKNMTAKQICCAAGERWRQMSADQKLTYVVWARKNQQQLDPRLRVGPSKSQRGVHGSKGVTRGTYRGGVNRSAKRMAQQKRRPSYIK